MNAYPVIFAALTLIGLAGLVWCWGTDDDRYIGWLLLILFSAPMIGAT